MSAIAPTLHEVLTSPSDGTVELWQMLVSVGRLQPGERILLAGGSSSERGLTRSIATLLGASTIEPDRATEDRETALRAFADLALVVGAPADMRAVMNSVRPGGRIVLRRGRSSINGDLAHLARRGLTLIGFDPEERRLRHPAELQEIRETIVALARAGQFEATAPARRRAAEPFGPSVMLSYLAIGDDV
jgi:NADPH:quinone reductase-like Zn-dependent oxidoreductase